MHPAWGVLLAYALGSIPFAWLAGRFRGVDLRRTGSGNLGATNVVRVLGLATGITVYLLDAAKGFAATFALPRLFDADTAGGWAVTYAVAAVAGHVRPLFLGFRRSGKGVATASGAFLGLAPLATAAALVVFMIAFVATGYVSVGSLAGAVTLPLALLALRPDTLPLLLVAGGLALFVFWTHRANIARLRRGEEHRFDLRRRGRARRGAESAS